MAELRSGLATSRRGFLGKSLGLSFALSIPGALFARPGSPTGAGASASIGAWVTIKPDGAIVLAIPVAEMGQGSLTGLAMVFAEDMDADWSRVSTVYPPPDSKTFGNPLFGNVMATFGSGSIRGYWDKVRLQAAAVRLALMQAAADYLRVALDELHTEPSRVTHPSSGRSLSYGEIARFAKAPAVMPDVDMSMLKSAADYRIIGKNIPRLDIPGKTDGSAQFGIDVQLPDMVYTTVLRSPVEGGGPLHVDDTAALSVPGVLKIVKLDHAVGVVAETVDACFAARNALRVDWSETPASQFSSAQGLPEFLAHAAADREAGVPYVVKGDAAAAFANAAKVVSAQYSTDYAYHAQMEPMNVTASVGPDGDTAEIWIGTQSVTNNVAAAAAILGTTADKIKLHQCYMGGGFGRRSLPDLLAEVLPIAKQMQRPVKLIWTREQDVQSAKMRPMTGHRIEAAFAANGDLIGWRHRIAGESTLVYRSSEEALEAAKGIDGTFLEGASHEYGIEHQSIEYLREKRGMAVASLRAIGAGYNKFATECFIDELAAAQKKDPVEFRLELLAAEPRAQAVIRAVAEKSNWGKPAAEGRALGFAYGKNVGTYIAAVGEISFDARTGSVRAHRFWLALDPGIAVNPDSILAQTEGNVIYGLSLALKERISITEGRIRQSNFHDYPVLRMSEVPEIDIQLMSTNNSAKGVGEAALPLIAPCIGNALFTLTGTRLRALPFSTDRLLKSNTA